MLSHLPGPKGQSRFVKKAISLPNNFIFLDERHGINRRWIETYVPVHQMESSVCVINEEYHRIGQSKALWRIVCCKKVVFGVPILVLFLYILVPNIVINGISTQNSEISSEIQEEIKRAWLLMKSITAGTKFDITFENFKRAYKPRNSYWF